MNRTEFVACFGGVYEHSAWVAEQVFDQGGAALDDLATLQNRLKKQVDAAPKSSQLALLQAHPDLAGRAARAGTLTEASAAEQAGAGLDAMSEEQFQRFHHLNNSYTEKFGFPFIYAVKGSGLNDILASFASRIDNDVETEFATALQHVHRIAGFRLQAWFAQESN